MKRVKVLLVFAVLIFGFASCTPEPLAENENQLVESTDDIQAIDPDEVEDPDDRGN